MAYRTPPGDAIETAGLDIDHVTSDRPLMARVRYAAFFWAI
jgi:hypothetical protein